MAASRKGRGAVARRALARRQAEELARIEAARMEGRTRVHTVAEAEAWASDNGYPVLIEPGNQYSGLTHLRAAGLEQLKMIVETVLARTPTSGALLSRYEED